MKLVEQRVAQESRAVTKKEVMAKAIEGKITWLQALDILGVCHREAWAKALVQLGPAGVAGSRAGRQGSRSRQIPPETGEKASHRHASAPGRISTRVDREAAARGLGVDPRRRGWAHSLGPLIL